MQVIAEYKDVALLDARESDKGYFYEVLLVYMDLDRQSSIQL